LEDIYDLLARYRVAYVRVDHPPVFTCAEAEVLVPPLSGAHTKNLFVRDGKGDRHFLLVVGWDKQVDLRQLAQLLGVDKLGMASAERLRRYLGLEPGAVTLLGVVNDADRRVEVVIDTEVWQEETLQCHPLVNSSTLAIARQDIERLLQGTGHAYRIVSVPSKEG